MAIQFGNNQATQPIGWYERLLYTFGPVASLGVGVTPVFSASNWNAKSGPMWQARLEMLQATQNSGVTLQWNGDDGNTDNSVSTGYTSALPSGVRQQSVNVNGVNNLRLKLTNQSGAPVTNYQLNYAVAMKRLTAVDKLEAQYAGFNGYQLNQLEMLALKQLDLLKTDGTVDKTGLQQMQALVAKGTGPMSLERIAQGIWLNRELAGPTDLFAPQSTSADNPFVTYSSHLDSGNPAKGRFPVLTEIAVEGGSSLNANIIIDRDGQLGYMQFNAQGFAQSDDAPWKVFIPALDYLTVHVINGSGQVSPLTVPIRLRVLDLSMSEILAVQTGRIVHPEQLGNPKTYWKTLVGLV